jgi:cyclohexanecarboxyl-CoA dehydrogenase
MGETDGFEASEEQESLRDAVRRLARKKFAPTYLTRSQAGEFPWEALASLAELGLTSLLTTPEFGGPEEPEYVGAGIACEELAYADFNVANVLIPTLITSYILTEFAFDELRKQWLPDLVAGRAYIALGLTEPETGSDAAALSTKAVAADGGWRISGEKTSITAVPHAQACIVFARTSPDGARGVSAFLVPLDSPGVTQAAIPDPGWRAVGRGSIAFDDVVVPNEAMIGEAGAGFTNVMAGFDFTRPLLALTAIGAAQASIDDAVAYVQQRRTFGAPLASYEGISFPLAEHSTKLLAARSLCYQALQRRAKGQSHTALAAMCKWLGPRSAVEAAHDCLLMFGHYGYTTDYPLEQRLRDIIAVEIADGTAQIQKIIIARELFGRAFVPYSRR